MFDVEDLLKNSIMFNCNLVFREVLRDLEAIGWNVNAPDLTKLAMKSNNLEALKYFLENYDVDPAEIREDSPAIGIRQFLEQSLTQANSKLIQISKKYPIYNEKTEKQYEFGSLKSATSIYVKEEILTHVLQPFCCLISQRGTGIYRIADIVLEDLAPVCNRHPNR